MDVADKRKIASVMRWVARVVALIVTLFLALFFFEGFLGTLMVMRRWSGFKLSLILQALPMLVAGVLTVTSCGLSMRRERTGGILFVITSLFILVWNVVFFWSSHGPAVTRPYDLAFIQAVVFSWMNFGMPLLVVGILFLASSWMSRQYKSDKVKTNKMQVEN